VGAEVAAASSLERVLDGGCRSGGGIRSL
jgi:hypothetical protein